MSKRKSKSESQIFVWHPSASILLIALMGITAYFGVWQNDFVYDDHDLIVNNPLIQEELGIAPIFGTEYWETTRGKSDYYRPLIILSFKIDYLLFKLHPAGYHVTNLVFHLLVSVLLFFIALKLQCSPLASTLASIIFAISPFHSQSVAWISGRTDILATVFSTISFLVFISAVNKNSSTRQAGQAHRFIPNSSVAFLFSGIFYFFALLSKEIALSLPLVVGAYAYFYLGPEHHKQIRSWTKYLTFLIPLLVYFYLRHLFVDSTFFDFREQTLEAWWRPEDGHLRRILTVPQILSWYLIKSIVPWPLVFERGVSLSSGLDDVFFYLGIFIIAVWLYIIHFFSKKRIVPAALGLTWFLISLLPISNILPVFESCMEHFSYFPGLGFALTAGYLLSLFLKKSKFLFLKYLLLVVIAIAFMTTIQLRLNDWKDDVTLFCDTVNKKPDSYRAQTQYGLSLYHNGKFIEALEPLKKAVALNPRHGQAHYNIGLVYRKLNRQEEAKQSYEKSTYYNPNLVLPLINLGAIHYKRGEYAKAKYYWSRALKLDPNNELARRNLSLIE